MKSGSRSASWLAVVTVVLALFTSCQRSQEAPKEIAGPLWSQWQTLLTATQGGTGAPTLAELAARAKKGPPLKPYRMLSQATAIKGADDLLGRAKTGKGSLELILPPVDWGAQPGKDRNAHMKRNDLRAIAPVVWATNPRAFGAWSWHTSSIDA